MFNSLDQRIPGLIKTCETQSQMISSQNVTIGELNKRLQDIENDFVNFREDINNRIKRLNNLILEKLDIQKEDTESLLIGLEKTFSSKINNLSDGKPTVTDLLKKIAKLEAVTDAIEHRRSSEEILGTLNVLNESMLKSGREEKDCSVLKEQIRILRWALGENI